MALSVLVLLVLFWHMTGIYMGGRARSVPLTLGLLGALASIGLLAILGAVAVYGLWTLREGGRRSGIAYLALLLLASAVAAIQSHDSSVVLGALFAQGVPLLALLVPAARRACSAEASHA